MYLLKMQMIAALLFQVDVIDAAMMLHKMKVVFT